MDGIRFLALHQSLSTSPSPCPSPLDGREGTKRIGRITPLAYHPVGVSPRWRITPLAYHPVGVSPRWRITHWETTRLVNRTGCWY